MNYFLAVDRAVKLNASGYQTVDGYIFTERELREWASDIFRIAQDAPLKKISAAMQASDWTLFRHIPPLIPPPKE